MLHGLLKIHKVFFMDFCYMDLLKLLHGFVSCSLSNKTKLKFDQDFKDGTFALKLSR